MKRLFLLLLSLLLVVSCQNNKALPIEVDRAYDIEFITKDLQPEDYRQNLEIKKIEFTTPYINPGQIPKIISKKENGEEFLWKQFDINSVSSKHNIGKLFEMPLRVLNFITYKNLLVGVLGSAMYGDSVNVQNTIDYLTGKYGTPVDLLEGYHKKSVINKELYYYWQNDDKIIGISHNGYNEGDYLTQEDEEKKKLTFFPVYEIYVFNKNVVVGLKKEGITLHDFFKGFSSGLESENLNDMLSDIKRKEEYPR